MPAADIRAELPSRADWAQLFALKQRWHVSIAALLMRAKDLEVMSAPAYTTAMKGALRSRLAPYRADPARAAWRQRDAFEHMERDETRFYQENEADWNDFHQRHLDEMKERSTTIVHESYEALDARRRELRDLTDLAKSHLREESD